MLADADIHAVARLQAEGLQNRVARLAEHLNPHGCVERLGVCPRARSLTIPMCATVPEDGSPLGRGEVMRSQPNLLSNLRYNMLSSLV